MFWFFLFFLFFVFSSAIFWFPVFVTPPRICRPRRVVACVSAESDVNLKP